VGASQPLEIDQIDVDDFNVESGIRNPIVSRALTRRGRGRAARRMNIIIEVFTGPMPRV
jgi:hypothetical protein